MVWVSQLRLLGGVDGVVGMEVVWESGRAGALGSVGVSAVVPPVSAASNLARASLSALEGTENSLKPDVDVDNGGSSTSIEARSSGPSEAATSTAGSGVNGGCSIDSCSSPVP
jgi:hypothetical protein